jgi:hypothetical protein
MNNNSNFYNAGNQVVDGDAVDAVIAPTATTKDESATDTVAGAATTTEQTPDKQKKKSSSKKTKKERKHTTTAGETSDTKKETQQHHHHHHSDKGESKKSTKEKKSKKTKKEPEEKKSRKQKEKKEPAEKKPRKQREKKEPTEKKPRKPRAQKKNKSEPAGESTTTATAAVITPQKQTEPKDDTAPTTNSTQTADESKTKPKPNATTSPVVPTVTTTAIAPASTVTHDANNHSNQKEEKEGKRTKAANLEWFGAYAEFELSLSSGEKGKFYERSGVCLTLRHYQAKFPIGCIIRINGPPSKIKTRTNGPTSKADAEEGEESVELPPITNDIENWWSDYTKWFWKIEKFVQDPIAKCNFVRLEFMPNALIPHGMPPAMMDKINSSVCICTSNHHIVLRASELHKMRLVRCSMEDAPVEEPEVTLLYGYYVEAIEERHKTKRTSKITGFQYTDPANIPKGFRTFDDYLASMHFTTPTPDCLFRSEDGWSNETRLRGYSARQFEPDQESAAASGSTMTPKNKSRRRVSFVGVTAKEGKKRKTKKSEIEEEEEAEETVAATEEGEGEAEEEEEEEEETEKKAEPEKKRHKRSKSETIEKIKEEEHENEEKEEEKNAEPVANQEKISKAKENRTAVTTTTIGKARKHKNIAIETISFSAMQTAVVTSLRDYLDNIESNEALSPEETAILLSCYGKLVNRKQKD